MVKKQAPVDCYEIGWCCFFTAERDYFAVVKPMGDKLYFIV